MDDNREIHDIWQRYDQKLDEVLTLNKTLILALTKRKFKENISSLKRPKWLMLLIGIPYTLLLCFVTWIAYKAEAMIVMFSFGIISLIMIAVIIGYIYQLALLLNIRRTEEVIEFQTKVAGLKISSFNIARISILQIPFWSACWISMDELINSPFVYGGINLIVFSVLSCLSYRLYKNLSLTDRSSSISNIVFSGSEWSPLLKASDLLDQIKALNNELK